MCLRGLFFFCIKEKQEPQFISDSCFFLFLHHTSAFSWLEACVLCTHKPAKLTIDKIDKIDKREYKRIT